MQNSFNNQCDEVLTEQLEDTNAPVLLSSTIYDDGEYYDCFQAGALSSSRAGNDIPFWISLAKRYSDPVLELGCGTGRISIPLAEEGFDITGLDIAESMLSIAKNKSSKVKWIQADARKFELKKKFSLIIFPYNALLHLQADEVKSCLDSVKKHLQPNGRFVIAIANPSPEFLTKLLIGQGKQLASIFQSPDNNDTIIVAKEREYDLAQQVLTVRYFYQSTGTSKEENKEFKVRIYFPQEINTLLEWNGFKIEQKFGDYDYSLFTSSSPYQLIICQPECLLNKKSF